MIELMGPAMAKSIMGDAYNANYRYELETTDEGLQVIITNKETGEASVLKLSEDVTENPHYDPIYEEEAVKARGTYVRRGFYGFVCAFAICAVLIAIACLVIFFVRPS